MVGWTDYPNGTKAFIAQTLPRDGAVGRRVDTVIGYTDHCNKRLCRWYTLGGGWGGYFVAGPLIHCTTEGFGGGGGF